MKFFIGPCVLESEELALDIASFLVKELSSLPIELYFKASFDKANRTSLDSFRGPGLEKGLEILSKVFNKTGLKILTDIHTPEQASKVAKVVHVMQIPAFLCRQTDLLIEAAKAAKAHNCIVKVKKGQFLAPEDTQNIVDKLRSILPLEQILLTERGSSFGYRNLIVDMASFSVMKSSGVEVIYDATHSVQKPGGLGTQTGGKREQIEVLAQAAVAAGCDGVFMETHPTPQKALSDSATCLPLDQVPRIVKNLLKIKKTYSELS